MRRHMAMASRVTAVAACLVLALAAVLTVRPATAATIGAVAAPANLRVTELDHDSFTLAWDPVPGASGYSVGVFLLDPFGTPRVTVDGQTATLDNLVFDVRHRVSVKAVVPGQFVTEAATIVVTTPLPEGYERPTTPPNLRVERNVHGRIVAVRWEGSTGGFGTLTYWLHLESPGFLPADVWVRTTGLAADANDLPVCDGCQYDPNQTIILWVTANDRRHSSPASQRITLTCCPF